MEGLGIVAATLFMLPGCVWLIPSPCTRTLNPNRAKLKLNRGVDGLRPASAAIPDMMLWPIASCFSLIGFRVLADGSSQPVAGLGFRI